MTLAIALALVLLVSAVICVWQTIDNVRQAEREQRILDELAPLTNGRKQR